MFTASVEERNAGTVLQYRLHEGLAVVSYNRFINSLVGNADFRQCWIDILKAAPFPVFRWETPALQAGNDMQPFECVLINSPGLASVTDRLAFQQHFAGADEEVVVFSNLGGDATLVVPAPLNGDTAYNHIGMFTQQAPDAQQQLLWQRVGEAMQARVSDKPVWLSTAGGGVSWLHVRLDDHPKYYHYTPYRNLPAG
ncbi:MAG: hypothetical protein AAF564_21190 [Bacteroidota bacterium]